MLPYLRDSNSNSLLGIPIPHQLSAATSTIELQSPEYNWINLNLSLVLPFSVLHMWQVLSSSPGNGLPLLLS